MNTNDPARLMPDPGTHPAPLGLHDIQGLVEIPSPWIWVAWAVAITVLGALAYFSFRYWRRTPHAEITKKPQTRPHERARQELERAGKHLADARVFCTKVSDAIRRYLEEQFDLNAPDRTTDEFLVELRHHPALTLAQQQRLADFLTQCDLAKFAKFDPGPAQLRQLHASALGLVDETQPAASPAVPSARIATVKPLASRSLLPAAHPPLRSGTSEIDSSRPEAPR